MALITRTKKRRRGRVIVAAGDASTRAVAERLKLTRLAMARVRKLPRLPQVQFYGVAGITPQAASNYENAVRRIDLDHAIALCDAHKLTLDWVYRNDPSGLVPYELQVAIADLRKKPRP